MRGSGSANRWWLTVIREACALSFGRIFFAVLIFFVRPRRSPAKLMWIKVERTVGRYGVPMNAVLSKLRTFGALLILVAGVVLAGTALVAADGGPSPVADEMHGAVGDLTGPIDKACAIASPQADCSTCCHDMGSSICCGHLVALGTEANARPPTIHHVLTGPWIPVAMHSASAGVGKRPPRYA